MSLLDGLSPEPAAVLVADPPWAFADALPGGTRGASKQYQCMTSNDVCCLALPPLAEDCYLFLWRVAAMVEEAYKVVRAWGFTPKSELVWRKLTKTGKPWFGMGHHVRMAHESCVIAVRGKPKVRDRATRSVFDADEGGMFVAGVPGHKHSAKPDEFYALVEALCVGPYTELFARRTRPGWTTLGNEIPGAPTTLLVK